MRDPNRIPIVLKKIEIAWSKVPDWRLSQLICNASFELNREDPFHIEDDLLIKGINRVVEKYNNET